MYKLVTICLLALFYAQASAQTDTQPRMPVRDFVSSEFIHGVPYDLAKNYNSDDVPELISMLSSNEMKPYWRNIIWVLAAIGDERALDVLIRFNASRFDGEVDNDTFSALIQINLAIGALAHRSDAAFEHIERIANPEYWRKNPVSWRYVTLKPGETELLMTQLAINGLGLTGRERAIEILESVDDRLNPRNVELYFKNNLEEAKAKARLSAEQGLQAVLSTSKYHAR